MVTRSPHVLVVDDEPTIASLVTRYLERDGFSVASVPDGDAALRRCREDPPDLVVLDLMLPGRPGLDVLRELRQTSDLPVIILTARGDESDRVAGLELGADDYVVKPFSPRELSARVRSVLRRSTRPSPPGERLVFGALVIDPRARTVAVDDEPASLTAREFDLLHFLAAHPRQVFTRAQLLRQVWRSEPDWQDPATVTVHVRRIRRKIERDPTTPRHVVTVRGVGYRFEP